MEKRRKSRGRMRQRRRGSDDKGMKKRKREQIRRARGMIVVRK